MSIGLTINDITITHKTVSRPWEKKKKINRISLVLQNLIKMDFYPTKTEENCSNDGHDPMNPSISRPSIPAMLEYI